MKWLQERLCFCRVCSPGLCASGDGVKGYSRRVREMVAIKSNIWGGGGVPVFQGLGLCLFGLAGRVGSGSLELKS